MSDDGTARPSGVWPSSARIRLQQIIQLEHGRPVPRREPAADLAQQRIGGLAFQDACAAVQIGRVLADAEVLVGLDQRHQCRQRLQGGDVLAEGDKETRILALRGRDGIVGDGGGDSADDFTTTWTDTPRSAWSVSAMLFECLAAERPELEKTALPLLSSVRTSV